MTVKAVDQATIADVTDAYNVLLTNDSHVFVGSTSTLGTAQSTTTQVVAMLGANQVAASVTLSEVVAPTGVTVTKDTDATSPTLTIALAATVAAAGTVDIPVHVGTDIIIHKTFSFSIAFRGAQGSTGATGAAGKGVSSTTITYQAGSSGTTAPTGTWSSSVPSVSAGQYLWTRTVIAYTDSTSSTVYSVGMMGATGPTGATGGTGKGISSTAVTYQASSSGTTAPTGTWSATIPSVGAAQYLWTRTVISYTDSTSSTSYAVGMMGATGAKGDTGARGAAGADALTLVVTSSNGLIFKNSAISTVLTAHVYEGGVEVTGTALDALGTIKWYKDGSTTAAATGATLTIDAGDVTGKATYVAQLEG